MTVLLCLLSPNSCGSLSGPCAPSLCRISSTRRHVRRVSMWICVYAFNCHMGTISYILFIARQKQLEETGFLSVWQAAVDGMSSFTRVCCMLTFNLLAPLQAGISVCTAKAFLGKRDMLVMLTCQRPWDNALLGTSFPGWKHFQALIYGVSSVRCRQWIVMSITCFWWWKKDHGQGLRSETESKPTLSAKKTMRWSVTLPDAELPSPHKSRKTPNAVFCHGFVLNDSSIAFDRLIMWN